MPVKRAPHPLCPFCGEDQHDQVKATKDGKRGERVNWHCHTCGKSWKDVLPCIHQYLAGCPHCVVLPASKTDVSGNLIEGDY